jgi:hypothetical protein
MITKTQRQAIEHIHLPRFQVKPAAEEGHNPARSPPKAPHSFMNSTQFCCKLAKPLQQMHECMYSLVLTCTCTLLERVNVFGVRTKYMYSTFQIRWDSEALVHSSCRQTSGNSVSETMHISVQFIPRSQDVYRQLLCLLKKNKKIELDLCIRARRAVSHRVRTDSTFRHGESYRPPSDYKTSEIL